MKQESIDSIERYINEKSDDKERAQVESLYIEGEDNLYFRNRLRKDWEQTPEEGRQENFDADHTLDRIHHEIRKRENRQANKPLQRLMLFYRRSAALFLIPLLAATLFSYFHYSGKFGKVLEAESVVQIYAPGGSRTSFSLPDGTTGMLNSGSTIIYSIPFAGRRNVNLEGEAWFEVVADENHPFTVKAGDAFVKVLGTNFNMSAYPSEDYVEVVLKEGKIEFSEDGLKEPVVLIPSERLVSISGKISKNTVDPSKYNAWTEGYLIFRGDPMVEVARRLERWYSVKITLADKKLEKYTFRATFLDDTLDDVLRFLALTSPISYEIKPAVKLPDGTVTMEEIFIYSNN